MIFNDIKITFDLQKKLTTISEYLEKKAAKFRKKKDKSLAFRKKMS